MIFVGGSSIAMSTISLGLHNCLGNSATTAGYANKIDVLQFGLADMPGVFVCLTTVLTYISFF